MRRFRLIRKPQFLSNAELEQHPRPRIGTERKAGNAPRTGAAVVAALSAPIPYNHVCSGSPVPRPDKCSNTTQLTRAGRRQMLRSSNAPLKWALALRRETQMAIGQQPRVERELPEELPPPKPITPLIGRDRGHDPYADIVATC